MGKMILTTMIILGFTGVVNASTVNILQINNCGDNDAAKIYTRVTSAG